LIGTAALRPFTGLVEQADNVLGGKSMRMAGAFALAVFPIIAAAAQDPARLQVAATGDQLSYEVVNLSPYQIVGFEVYTQFTSGGYEHLGCGVKANVKAPTDL